ncbi:uncharacterized protein ACNLHF_004522 isoform 1-T1 [Anomaloglossus baeobatrachus]
MEDSWYKSMRKTRLKISAEHRRKDALLFKFYTEDLRSLIHWNQLNSRFSVIYWICYSRLPSDPTTVFMTRFRHLLDSAHQGDHLATTLFRKHTATNSLLEYQSFHPQHIKNGVPTGSEPVVILGGFCRGPTRERNLNHKLL